jgi:hypothetical protein
MRLRLVAGVCVAASVMPMMAAAQGNPGDAATHWPAIVECGAERSAAARHACVDRVLRSAGVLSEARVVQETREEFGRQNRAEAPRTPPTRAVAAAPASAAATAAPAPAASVASAAAPPARAAEIDRLVTSIAAVRTIGYRRLRVTTTDGSVWDQTRDETFNTPPKVGDTFSIERASLGSFQCRFARASNYRCERVD